MTKKSLIYFCAWFCLCYASNVLADINLAIITPQHGDYKYDGNDFLRGAEIAVEELNTAGGLAGEKINLISIEDPCDDVLSVTTAQMITLKKDDKFNAVIGSYCSNANTEVADIYKKAKIVQILPVVNRDYYAKQASAIFEYLQKDFPDKKFAVVYDNAREDNVGVATAIQEIYVKAGMPGKVSIFNYATSDDLVKDILAGDNRIVYIMGSINHITTLAKMLREQRADTAIMANRYQLNQKYDKTMGKNLENSYKITLPSLKENPNFAEYLVKLRLHGVEPDGLMGYGYLAVKEWEAKAQNHDDQEWLENYRIYKYSNGEYTQVY